MAVLPPGKGSRRRPSFRGNILQDTTRGVERTRIWPEPKGSRQTKAQLDQQEWFRQVNWAFKYMAAPAQAAFRKATQGTALYPRDLLSMIASPSFIAFKTPEGKVAYPVAYLQAVSESLDTITTQIGYTLVRGPEFWTGQPVNAPAGQLVTRVIRTTDQGIPTGDTTLSWQAEVYDELGMWQLSDPTKLVVPPNVSRLSFGAEIFLQGGVFRSSNVQLKKNGTTIVFDAIPDCWGNQATTMVTGDIPVNAGDVFQLVIGCSNGASKSIRASASAFWARYG